MPTSCGTISRLKDAITLPGASINYVKLKKDLSQSVRNHKHPGTSRPRTSVAVGAKVVLITSNEEGAKVQDNLLPMTLEELQKEYKKSKPSKDHIKRLLTGTVGNYKNWIENNIPTISDVLEQYPVLKCPDWIIFQAGLLLGVHKDFYECLEERLKLLFQSTSKIYDKVDVALPVEDDNEKRLYFVLSYMESCINAKKCSSIFLVNEVGCVNPKRPNVNTPTLVVIKSATKNISQAFLFVEKTLICEVMQPTVIGLLILWVCTHYCFNLHYGKETINLSQVLEDCVLRDWGTNSIQSVSSKNAVKSRKVLRSSKIQTFYGRLKCHGYEI